MKLAEAQERALSVAIEVARVMFAREIDRAMLAGATEVEARAEANRKDDEIAAMAEAARVRAFRMMLEPYGQSHDLH